MPILIGFHSGTIYWSQLFYSENEADLELALGYMYALVLIAIPHAKLTIVIDGQAWKQKHFYRMPAIQARLLGYKINPPIVEYTLNEYIIHTTLMGERFKQPTMNYIGVFTTSSEEDAPVIIMQFNHLTFLQGFLSILTAFRVGLIRYLVTIYDREGIQYVPKLI